MSADRLELANAQYLGWALKNRSALLPTREQLEGARSLAAHASERLQGKMEVVFVTPDYYSTYPKSCMDGWGRRFIVVNPEGFVLPCHLAQTIPGLQFDNVADRRLEDIWRHSSCFNRFRGEDWFPDPCRTCHRRTIDFGGCRCQAFHLTGNAGVTDPACSLSYDHGLIEAARKRGHAQRRNAGPVRIPVRSEIRSTMIRRMDISLVILLTLAVSAALFAFVKDRSLPMEGLYASGRLIGNVWIELLLGFLIAGLVEVLISPPQITAWLGPESSMRGIFIGWMAGLAIPGGPYLLFPLAAGSVHKRSGSRCLDCVDYRQDIAEPGPDADV